MELQHSTAKNGQGVAAASSVIKALPAVRVAPAIDGGVCEAERAAVSETMTLDRAPEPVAAPMPGPGLAGFRAKAIAVSPEVSPRPAQLIEKELEAMARGASSREFTEKVYNRAREILEEAYESAAELRIEALSRIREQIDRVAKSESDTRSRLGEEADALKAQATLESKLALQRAQREADAIIARARSHGEKVVQSANEHAAAVKSQAQHEARGVVDDARRITEEARQRIREVERLEGQFERVALDFAQWLGASVDTKQSRLARIRAAAVLKG